MVVALALTVEVDPDRIDEIRRILTHDAEQSRKEEGCLRFDVMRDSGNPSRFFFYEVYANDAAIAAHKVSHPSLVNTDSATNARS